MLPIVLLAVTLGIAPELERVLEAASPDSLLAPLRSYELLNRRSTRAAEAALLLGDLHVVRGEYRLAADAYSRAAAGFDPARKQEAQYRAGLAWLGAGEARRARALLEEVESGAGERRADASLGVAYAWVLEHQPERALKRLTKLVAGRPGEAGAAALGEIARLAERLGEKGQARNTRERLRRDYPDSFEAQGVGPEGEPDVVPARGRP